MGPPHAKTTVHHQASGPLFITIAGMVATWSNTATASPMNVARLEDPNSHIVRTTHQAATSIQARARTPSDGR
ncbi:MAG: hypothetical protein KY469_04530 [Actinobacteria bacterium]|nr:hypothetical protein [Actinomycetota bacterium]